MENITVFDRPGDRLYVCLPKMHYQFLLQSSLPSAKLEGATLAAVFNHSSRIAVVSEQAHVNLTRGAGRGWFCLLPLSLWQQLNRNPNVICIAA